MQMLSLLDIFTPFPEIINNGQKLSGKSGRKTIWKSLIFKKQTENFLYLNLKQRMAQKVYSEKLDLQKKFFLATQKFGFFKILKRRLLGFIKFGRVIHQHSVKLLCSVLLPRLLSLAVIELLCPYSSGEHI